MIGRLRESPSAYRVAVTLILSVVILIVTGVVAGQLTGQVNDLASQRMSVESDIDDLSQQEQALESSSGLDETDAARQLKAADALAKQMADDQNAYIQAGADTNKVAEIAKDAAGVLDSDSTDEAALWIGSGTWQHYVTYDVSSNQFHVLWLCHDGSGQLLAYGHGIYNDENDKLSQVSHETTVIGNGASATLQDRQQSLQESINAVGDAVDAAGQETNQTPPSESDMQAIADAREKAREDAGVSYDVPDVSTTSSDGSVSDGQN